MDLRTLLYLAVVVYVPPSLCKERRTYTSSVYDIDAKVSLYNASGTYIQEAAYLASYSNYSANRYTSTEGVLFRAGESFGCVRIQAQNSTLSYDQPVPSQPFVAFIRLTFCEHYHQALYAQEKGAVGVIFYSDIVRNLKSSYQPRLSIPVVSITLTESEQSTFERTFTNVTAVISLQYLTIGPSTHSKAFFFVVFAFSILILLSITWFLISYIRRCFVILRGRQRRIHEETMTLRTHKNAIKSLPTRKYEPLKDTASSTSSDDPTCAVCLESFVKNELIRELPCRHEFHQSCVDPWLEEKGTCPLCKYNIVDKETRPTVTVSATSPFTSDNASISTGDSSNDSSEDVANDTEEEALSLDSLAHIESSSSSSDSTIPLTV